MNTAPLSECLDFAVRAARRAGEVVMPYYQGGVAVETKSDGTPVTLADRGAEQELRRVFRERFPDDAVLGEEFGELPGTSGRRWVLDPIDGTQSFVRGVPLFGVLIGMEEAGRPVLGVIYLPALGELVYAASGLGCWWLPAGHGAAAEPRRARVSDTPRLADCTAVTTSFEYFAKAGRPEVYDRLQRAVRRGRGWGDCYAHVLVATGRADVAVEPMMHVWDNAPLLPVVVEAGGAFTDWTGAATIAGGDAISSNGKVHAEALRLVRGA